MLNCPAGTYQDLTAQTTCKSCPEKKYCPGGSTVGTVTPIDCPNGHYCPEGTQNYEIFRCFVGTYHKTSDGPLADSAQCTACEAKFYCPKVGMTETDYPSYPCANGYLCAAGSESATGTSECPKDHYCIAGTQTICP